MTDDKGLRIRPEDYSEALRMPIRLVLDNIRSGQNVGAFFRSADAFRAHGLDLCGITCHPPHRDILKSALGASNHVPWVAYDNTLDAIAALRREGWKIAAAEQHSSSLLLNHWEPLQGEQWAVVFGNEVRGISDEVLEACDVVIEMPQFGVKKSINVSVCAGIYLWQASMHMPAIQ